MDIAIFGIPMKINKVAFTVFGHDVQWYGIIIAVAFLLAAFYVTRRAPRFGISGDDVIDALLFAVPVSIIFARLYYVVFKLENFTGPNAEKIWAIFRQIVSPSSTTRQQNAVFPCQPSVWFNYVQVQYTLSFD